MIASKSQMFPSISSVVSAQAVALTIQIVSKGLLSMRHLQNLKKIKKNRKEKKKRKEKERKRKMEKERKRKREKEKERKRETCHKEW